MSQNKDPDSNEATPTDKTSLSRRRFLQATGAAGAMYWLGPTLMIGGKAYAQFPGVLDATTIPQFGTPLLIPPVMPKSPNGQGKVAPGIDYYEIAVRQFPQQILPTKDELGNPLLDAMGNPLYQPTMVWGYGPVHSKGRVQGRITYAPSLTIEARANVPVRVKWINELVDANGNYLPHLLPVDPTLHWANPPGGAAGRDTRPDYTGMGTPDRYNGPVPVVTHVHGAVGVGEESDGYPEAWFLPDAADIPNGFATEGRWYDTFKAGALDNFDASWGPGYAVYQYPNENRACTLWYHDHTLGITRLNVYAGPAGFYIVRGGQDGDGAVLNGNGMPAVLPGPAPQENDKFPPNKRYYEIPIVIQDRSFNDNGSLFYPSSREFFDGITGPYIGDVAMPTDVSPIWNPEFFGDTLMVNGSTWPYLEVEPRRYRLRFLNGCQSRFLILDFNAMIDAGAEVWQIGNEGGFLEAPYDLSTLPGDKRNRLLMALAERADIIVDFSNVAVGQNLVLGNVGPDEPFGGGTPGFDFAVANPATTGKVMQFRVVPLVGVDDSTLPKDLTLPAIQSLYNPTLPVRRLALVEEMSQFFADSPTSALLGIVEGDTSPPSWGTWSGKLWAHDVSEAPVAGDTEVWEIYNTTGDAHPIHVHEVVFEVLNRQDIFVDEANQKVQTIGMPTASEPWESGRKDTVVAYPGQVTRIVARFHKPGRFVWHCHIIEHEDNEMMRPFEIQPAPMP